MSLDLDTARLYLKADGDDDAVITLMITYAQMTCQGYCNRVFYATQAALDADRAQALLDYTAAVAAQQTEIAANTDPVAQAMIVDHYSDVIARIKGRINGIVLDALVEAAIYLTLGHFYYNRQDVVVAASSAVSQMPVGAQRILQPYLWIGDLGGC